MIKPIKFKECNITYAENQPEYLPLPVYKHKDGTVISCWKFSFKERIKLVLRGRIYLSVLTFNQPLQPIFLSLNKFEVGI